MESTKISNLDILATKIAELYHIPAITSCRSAVHIDFFNEKFVPDQVSRVPGHMDLNMMLRYAAQHYKPKVVRNSAEDKELADLKVKVGPLSAHVDRLERAYYKNLNPEEEKRDMYEELKHKKDELETMRLRFGELSTNKTVVAHSDKLTIIKQAFKILSNYHKKKYIATELYNKIKSNLEVKVHTVHYMHGETNDDCDEDEYIEEYDYTHLNPPKDGWTSVGSEKKNPFASMKKKNTWEPPVANGGAGASTSAPSNVNELITRYNDKKYLTPGQRMAVLAELEKREKKKPKKDEFPTLSGFTEVVIPKSSLKMNFAEMAAKKLVVETIEKPKKILSETMINGKKFTLVEMESEEPILINDRIENNFRFRTYEYKDGITVTTSTPTPQFYEQFSEDYQYEQYLREVKTKPWLFNMDYEEWCDFRNDCEYQEELEYSREMEKYNTYGLSEYVPECARDDYDCEYDEHNDHNGYEDNYHDELVNPKKDWTTPVITA
jgi:hypothetical protein